MISLLLIYFVGKAFYDLAGTHDKGQWPFAILGVVSYFAGYFAGSFLLALSYGLFLGSFEDINENEIVLSILSIPLGVLCCWGFYRILKSRWEKEETFSGSSEDVLDANMIDQNPEKL